MLRILAITFSFTLFFSATSIFAAPFCVSTANSQKCDYYDYTSCISAAGSKGICTLNEMEMKNPIGEAPFCLATVYATKCSYYDEAACKSEANNFASVCIKNKNLR
jgi:hypothetical protein